MKKTRKTKQKDVIKEIICNTVSHPTADWIYEQARKEIPNISLGTIYRNLNSMKEAGEIQELDFGSSYSRFDGNPDPHYHFRCISCNNVFDVNINVQQQLDDAVNSIGFEARGHRLEFYGHCPSCKQKQ